MDFENLYLTSDSESESSEFDCESEFYEYEKPPSPIKLNNVNIWESSCCITFSPIVSSKEQKCGIEPITIPTMYSLSKSRIQNIFNTFF